MGAVRPFPMCLGLVLAAASGAAAAEPHDGLKHVSDHDPAVRADEPSPFPNGLIAALPVTGDLQLGIGRYKVNAMLRQPNNTEAERPPLSMRSRDRGIAAVGVSLRF